MSKMNSLTMQAFASVLILFLSACAEEPLGGDQTGKGHTVTLQLSAIVAPILETKAIPAHSGSEAEKAGFYYEMVSSNADQAATTPGLNIKPMPVREDSSDVNFATKALVTKAPATLKNAYALLFTSAGAFNGRAPIGVFTVGTPQDITFTNVVNPTATGCRLVIVANNNAAVTSYASSAGTGGFAGFTGNYAEFQKLTITSAVNQDIDVPYAGSVTVDLSQNEIGATADVTLSWTLAKITLNNPMFNITGGPARSSSTLYNAGQRRFAPDTNNNYNGIGSTPTTAFVASTAGSNANSVTWYVGENIQPAVASIKTSADRNSSKAPTNACYIRIVSATLPVSKNTSPKIGEEYTQGGSKSFTYDYYLGKSSDVTDFALRRHIDYTISTEISSTMAVQEEIAARDGRVTLTRPELAGLAIGLFGGASGYTDGTGTPSTISGSYTKMLLLQPNTSGSTARDSLMKQWSTNLTTELQPETRKYWDHTYTLAHIDKTPGFAYDYCYNLTLGGVAKGTWYLPTHAQLLAMWSAYGGLQGNNLFANYSAFYTDGCWASTESTEFNAWRVYFNAGYSGSTYKPDPYGVRCVRDAISSQSAPMVTEVGGYPVIDLSALNPLGCVLSSSEAVTRRTAMYAPGVTPSNSALLSVGLDVSGPKGTWNAKMSTKFQIMKQGQSVVMVDFVNAWNACKTYVGEGGSAGTWRLPTQRELDMIWVLHPQLIGKAGFTVFGGTNYWSSTEDDAEQVWRMRFSDGYPSSSMKTEHHHVRCVKDL